MEHTYSTIAPRPIVIRQGVALLRADERARSLPRPHDPEDRVLLATLGGWELRDFAEKSSFAVFFARHGLAHRQLFHRELALSILTPSKFTDEQFELCASGGRRARLHREDALRARLFAEFGALLPEHLSLRAAGRWL